MRVLRREKRGMTLVEMLTSVTILMIMISILSQVFSSAGRAANKGRAMVEIHQVGRAIDRLLANDLSGATSDYFVGGENGRDPIPFFPDGPYHSAIHAAPSTDEMNRMLAGGSDYLAFKSTTAGGGDKAVAYVYYCLRASGELIRVTDVTGGQPLYDGDAFSKNVDPNSAYEMNAYEERRVVAENVERVKFSYLDRGTGAMSSEDANGAYTNSYGVWRNNWDQSYLPAAVKIEVRTVDRKWILADTDRIAKRAAYNRLTTTDSLRPEEMFDADDGEDFSFIVALPLAMQ